MVILARKKTSENGKYALALARHGYSALPCCWPDGPKCGCPRQHSDEKDIGKAPLTAHGVKDATTDPGEIAIWWRQWPMANVAIRLGPDLIMLDPDSDEARKECYSLGVPETLTRYSRNKAFIFSAPLDLGNVMLTHKGESHAIDILNGYCLVYGTHRTGARIFLENPTATPALAPAWTLEWIERFRSKRPAAKELDPNAPPVRLRPQAMKWWVGEKTVHGLDGDVDRSATLFNIGLVLAGANASAETIVAALEDRDVALGYAKYSERKDADVRYADIAGHAISAQNAQRRRAASPHRSKRSPAWQVRG